MPQGRKRRLFWCCFAPPLEDEGPKQVGPQPVPKPEPPPPPLPPPRPPPPPPPPPRFPGPPLPPKGVPPTPPVKKLNVRHLQWKGLKDAAKDSIWARSSMELEIDEDELVDIFGNKTVAKPLSKAKPKQALVRLLDAKKAQNVEIATKSLKLHPEQLVVAILRVDTCALGETCDSLVDTLLKYAPSRDEEAKLKNYKGEYHALGPAEQLWTSLMPVVRLEDKLHLLQFRNVLHERVGPLDTKINFVISVSQKVQQSKKLPTVLRTVLVIGNKLNQGTARANTKGITPDDLIVVGRTKGFMHYLCKVVAERRPELLTFWEDFVDDGQNVLQDAMKIDTAGLESQVREIEKGKEKVCLEHEHLKVEKEVDDIRFAKQEAEKMSKEDRDAKRRREMEDARKAAASKEMEREDMRERRRLLEAKYRRVHELVKMNVEDTDARKRLGEESRVRVIEVTKMLGAEREDERERIYQTFHDRVERAKVISHEWKVRRERELRELVEAEELERMERERVERLERVMLEKKVEEEREWVERGRKEAMVRESEGKREREARREKERVEREQAEREAREDWERVERELKDQVERDERERLDQDAEIERQEELERDHALALLQQKLKSGEIKIIPVANGRQDETAKARLVNLDIGKEKVVDVTYRESMEKWGEDGMDKAPSRAQQLVAKSLEVWLTGEDIDNNKGSSGSSGHDKQAISLPSNDNATLVAEKAVNDALDRTLVHLGAAAMSASQHEGERGGTVVVMTRVGDSRAEKSGAMTQMNGHAPSVATMKHEMLIKNGLAGMEVSEGGSRPLGTVEEIAEAGTLDGTDLDIPIWDKAYSAAVPVADCGNGEIGGRVRTSLGDAREEEDGTDKDVEIVEASDERELRFEREREEQAEMLRKEEEARQDEKLMAKERREMARQDLLERQRLAADKRANQEKLARQQREAEMWQKLLAEAESRAETFWAVDTFLKREVEPGVETLQASMQRLARSTTSLSKYFGVDPKSSPYSEIFSVLYDFVEQFKRAHAENEQRKKSAAEKAAREAAAEARKKRAEERRKRLEEEEESHRRSMEEGRDDELTPLRISTAGQSPGWSPAVTPGAGTPSSQRTLSPFASLSPINSPMLQTPISTPPLLSPRGSGPLPPWLPEATHAGVNLASPSTSATQSPPPWQSPLLDKIRKRQVPMVDSSLSDDDFEGERPQNSRDFGDSDPTAQSTTPALSFASPPTLSSTRRARIKYARSAKAIGSAPPLKGAFQRTSSGKSRPILSTSSLANSSSQHSPPLESLILAAFFVCLYLQASDTIFQRAGI